MANLLENSSFKTVGIRVENNDSATTVVDICFEQMNDFVQFHKICDVRSIQMRLSIGLANDTDKATPYVVYESNALQMIAAESQTTPAQMSSPTGRASNAKRRNTEEDASGLETNKRKSMRSNDRSIVKLVEVRPSGGFGSLIVTGDVGNEHEDASIWEMVPTQSNEDAEASDSNLSNDREKTAQRTTEIIIIDADALPSEGPVTNGQSNEHESGNENIVDSHIVGIGESNKLRETTTNASILSNESSPSSGNTVDRRRTAVYSNSRKRRVVQSKVHFSTDSFADKSSPAILDQGQANYDTNNVGPGNGEPTTSRAEDKQDEQNENGGSEVSTCGVPDHGDSESAKQQSKMTTDAICAVDSKRMEAFHIECKSRGGCQELFESAEAMMYHVTTYHAKGIKRKFSCHLCKKTSTERANLQRHMNAVHIGLRHFKCPFPKCSKAFARKEDLQLHTNAIHTKKIAFKCPKCLAKFYYKQLLTRHLANEHGQGITFSCYLCKKSLGDKRSLHRHMDAAHIGFRRFKCPFPECSMAFTQKGSLQQHTNVIHTKKIEFKCTKCSAKSYRKDYLTRHLANVHGKGITFSCYLCKKSLGDKRSLHWHMDAMHIGLRRFKCPFPKCSMAFTRSDRLQQHTNAIHTKKIEFKCTKCPAKFYQKADLTRHLANEHGQGIVSSCYLCKKSLCNKQILRQHMDAVHMGLRRFKCPFPKCSKAFAQKRDLQQHTNAIHTKKIVFKCTKCPAIFYYKQYLTRHLANKHGLADSTSARKTGISPYFH